MTDPRKVQTPNVWHNIKGEPHGDRVPNRDRLFRRDVYVFVWGMQAIRATMRLTLNGPKGALP